MIDWFAHRVVPAHRVIFVVATALLGVAGSFVASDPRSISSWIFFVGSALGMYAGDVCNEIETDARTLASPGEPAGSDARLDALESRRPRALIAICILSLLMVMIGFASGGNASNQVPALPTDPTITSPSSPVAGAAVGLFRGQLSELTRRH
jgi:hypothetical protein